MTFSSSLRGGPARSPELLEREQENRGGDACKPESRTGRHGSSHGEPASFRKGTMRSAGNGGKLMYVFPSNSAKSLFCE